MIYLLKIFDISYVRVCIFFIMDVMYGWFVNVLDSIYICILLLMMISEMY